MRLLILVLVFLGGCATVSDVDRSDVNHPAMDLKNRLTPASQNVLTSLGNVGQSTAGAACATCAH